MFKVNTLIVLGAGASKSYGYPLGQELIDGIVASCNPNNTKHSPNRVAYTQLRDRLKFYEPFSIDAFLTHYQADKRFVEAAKMKIVEVLLQPKPSKAFQSERSNGHWYRFFWDALVAGSAPDELASENHDPRFNVITFNYDVSLEHYLLSRIFSHQGFFSEEQKRAFWQKISKRIHHVYGSIENVIVPGNLEEYRPGNQDLDEPSLVERSKRIQLIDERKGTDYVKLRDLFADISQVIFLGFGFDETNIGDRVLNINKMLNANIHLELSGMRTIKAIKYTNLGNSERINRRIAQMTEGLPKEVQIVKSEKTTYEALEQDFSLNSL